MILTKTDFIQYLNCPESLWLAKNKTIEYEKHKGKFSLFLEKLTSEGYEVEEYAKRLFPFGIELPENSNPKYTSQQLQTDDNIFFQPSFVTDNNEFARIDILEKLNNNTFHLYEIKSSTSVKKEKLQDACFQKYVLNECGYNVSKVSIIHLNKEYVKNGDIIPEELIEISDVTEQIDGIYSSTVNKIKTASNFINKKTINENGCSCRYKTRSNHCDTFSYFNSDVPEFSIYEIERISSSKIAQLVDNNQLSILDIPLNFTLNPKQKAQVESVRQMVSLINQAQIHEVLSDLKFPLHFIDYETYASAIPKADGLSPHKHLVFQVSIHTLNEDNEIKHFEWLGDKIEMPTSMIKKMEDFTKHSGTFISWYAPFEKGRNKDMIQWLPEFKSYLDYINNNMFDLMDIFKENYIDYRFHGSASIKKVLPVLCPQFSYNNLEVQDGTMALDTWGRMVTEPDSMIDIEQTKLNLLEYCKLDTLAMVKIFEKLNLYESNFNKKVKR